MTYNANLISKAKSPHNCWTVSKKNDKSVPQHVFNECNIPVAQCYTKETQQFSNLFRFLLFSEIKAKFHQLIDDKLSFVQKNNTTKQMLKDENYS